MRLPFTVEQFFEVFGRYNRGVWPAQVVLFVLGLIGVALVFSKRRGGARLTSVILAALWAWMAVAYHLVFFTAINPAAWLFGIVFVLQALLFLGLGVRRLRGRRGPTSNVWTAAGAALVAYAMAIYPLVGYFAGHRYPLMATFGVPCPTTIFTFGVLLLVQPPFPRYAFVIPLLWSGVGSFAAFGLGVPQDFGLLVAGALGLVACAPPRRASPPTV